MKIKGLVAENSNLALELHGMYEGVFIESLTIATDGLSITINDNIKVPVKPPIAFRVEVEGKEHYFLMKENRAILN